MDDVLYVGQRVFFYPEPRRNSAKRFDGVIRGWQRDGYILLELFGGPEQPLLFRRGAACSTRFLKEGVACAIDSTVMDSQVISCGPTVRVAWTERLRVASLRRAPRLEVNFLCEVTSPDAVFPGQVCDMSTLGVGILAKHEVEPGARLVLRGRLPDGVEVKELALEVRNLRHDMKGRVLLGCAFADEDARDAQAAGFFVTSTLLRRRDGFDEEGTVLILDDDALAVSIIQKQLAESECIYDIHENLLDGVFRARLRAPSAILMRYHWGALTALDVCHLLRQGQALQSTGIFVYGEEADAHALELRRAGATGILTSLERPTEVLDYLRKGAQQRAAG